MNEEIIPPVLESLRRVQDFNIESLKRDDLGRELEFSAVLPEAQRIIGLYKRVPTEILSDLSSSMLDSLKQRADADYNIFNSIIDFSVEKHQSDLMQQRNRLTQQVLSLYDSCFPFLVNYITYGVARLTDITLFETSARAALQQINDEISKEKTKLEEIKKSAQDILESVKKVAAEQGVTQQAIYFKEESEIHAKEAKAWSKYIGASAVLFLILAIFSLFIHKIDTIRPESTIDSIQIISSKIIIFAILGYLIVLFSKVYISHKHNSIINKHRQNALLTYKSLVDASKNKGTEDIVLAHASSCIFSPQETGYVHSPQENSSKSVLELLTKTCASADSLK